MLRKKLLSILIAAMTISIFTASGVEAADASNTQQIIRGERHAGIKTGLMFIDENGVDDIIPLGILYGRNLERLFPNLWVEAELNVGVFGGDWDAEPVSGVKVDADYNILSLAAYGVYRYSITNAAYLKGKIGLLFESIGADYSFSTATVSGEVDHGGNNTSISVGLGGGYQINNVISVEAEVTMLEPDIGYMSVGFNYNY